MSAPFPSVISSLDQLRSIYRNPSKAVEAKKVGGVDEVTARFIEASPFLLLATSNSDGSCDVSPRGGPRGFVHVLDSTRLLIPDLNGNNLLDSMTNIVANPHVGLLFLMPGTDETLRLNGRACLTNDPELLDSFDEVRTPKLAIGVEVTDTFMHCAKAFRRGSVWDPSSWDGDGPDGAELLVSHTGTTTSVEDMRAWLESSYTEGLAADVR